MVIEKIPSICFSSEFGDIIISGVTTSLVAQFSISGELILKETYYPDASGIVTIRDIGKVLNAYFNIEDFDLSDSNYSTVLTLGSMFTEGTDSVSKSTTVYYCTAETGIDLNSDEKYVFLTRYTYKKTAIDRKEFISYYMNGQTIYLGIAYLYNNTAKYLIIVWQTPATNLKVRAVDASLKAISTILNSRTGLTIPVDSIIYYDVIAKVNDLPKRKLHFVNDKRNFSQKKNLVYRNCFGAPETFTCTGLDEQSIELNGEYGYVSGNYRKISTEPVISDKINTGYMNAVAAASLEDLILSDKIFLYDDNALADQIVITDIEMVKKQPSNQPISYTLTYRPAKQNHLKFNAGGAVKSRIFDSSFNYSFD